MFTGIVSGLFKVKEAKKLSGIMKLAIPLSPALAKGLQIGASVSVDGVCLTVVQIKNKIAYFDVIQETLDLTTLGTLHENSLVNLERAARFSDEIGGHLLSGHVFGKAEIKKIETWAGNKKIEFQGNKNWAKYLFRKGFIAIDGVSLTLVDVTKKGTFTVHLIPETLRNTTLGVKKKLDWVNIEIDSQTLAVVETVERVLGERV